MEDDKAMSRGAEFGDSVAISGDGNTVLIGAYSQNDYRGAAYVFARTATGWRREATIRLHQATSLDVFGQAVALSGDGRTALIAANGKRKFTGAVYVYRRSGASWHLQQELTARDGQQSDAFGFSVALSADGNTAIIGAPWHAGTGAVYVFTAARSSWRQQELTAKAAVQGNTFGYDLVLAGNGKIGLVGAPSFPDGGSEAAYVFVRSRTGWAQRARLSAPHLAKGDCFGLGLALNADGKVALVAAEFQNHETGAVYAFEQSAEKWQMVRLGAAQAQRHQEYGAALALSGSGDRALVSANGENDAGIVYVLVHHQSGWVQERALTATDAQKYDLFGWSIGLSADGTSALIGAPLDSAGAGSAYVFSQAEGGWNVGEKLEPGWGQSDFFAETVALSGDGAIGMIGARGARRGAGRVQVIAHDGNWVLQASLTPHSPSSGDAFGSAIALSIDGQVACIGAPGRSASAGAAYIFTRRGKRWKQEAVLAAGGRPGDMFGNAVAISADDSTVLVAARGARAVYVFKRSRSGWSPIQTLTAPQTAVGFGTALALSRDADTALIGAPGDSGGTGAVYAFAQTADAWRERSVLVPGATSGGAYFGDSVVLSADGTTALVGAEGEARAYVFANSGGTWQQEAVRSVDGIGPGALFGHAVAIDGDGSTVLISAPDGKHAPGAVYAFGADSSGGSEEQRIRTGQAELDDQFGVSIALSDDGSSAIIGSMYESGVIGVAYLYARPETSTGPPQPPEFPAPPTLAPPPTLVPVPPVNVQAGAP